jgi:pyruvate ferredoxin oxidoreductase alpha subunit
VLVNLDGFYLSFTREPVEIPDLDQVRKFLPPFAPKYPTFRASQPVAHGVAVLEASVYSYFRYQLHRAMENVLEVHDEAADDFERLFGRRYAPIDAYCTDDAETILVMAGSFATKGKAAVNHWRSQGRRVGLIRLRLVRPFPKAVILAALASRRAVGVIDQNLSPGLGGIFYHEIAATLAGSTQRPPILRSFIAGLGGKDISQAEFDHVLDVLESGEPGAAPVEPELLLTESELKQVQARLETAAKPILEAVP